MCYIAKYGCRSIQPAQIRTESNADIEIQKNNSTMPHAVADKQKVITSIDTQCLDSVLPTLVLIANFNNEYAKRVRCTLTRLDFQ